MFTSEEQANDIKATVFGGLNIKVFSFKTEDLFVSFKAFGIKWNTLY